MKSITKWNKSAGEITHVTTEEFLQFVGSGQKTREAALTALIEGGMFQNVEVAFYIAPLKNAKSQNPQTAVNITFPCNRTWENGVQENWEGKVKWIVEHGGHVEFYVTGRGSGFTVIAGKTQAGTFMMIPFYNAAFDLADPTDLFYNEEKVLQFSGDKGPCNTIDGITAVCGLKALAESGLFPE